MLDQLVESKGTPGAQNRLLGFLALFGALIMTLALGGYIWSIIDTANNSSLSADLDLDTLVAPVALPEEAPPPPEIKPQEERKQQDDLPTRKENIAAMTETPPDAPKEISTKQNTAKERPPGKFNLSDVDSGDVRPDQAGRAEVGERVTGPGGSGQPTGPGGGDGDGDAPPPTMATPTPKPVIPKIVSKGVVNGNAISLPKPAYPPTAKAVGANGAVSVQVTIDESGNVISAVATSGHPLLKSVAAQAARSAKFRPTLLSGTAVKVSGIIVYNFQ